MALALKPKLHGFGFGFELAGFGFGLGFGWPGFGFGVGFSRPGFGFRLGFAWSGFGFDLTKPTYIFVVSRRVFVKIIDLEEWTLASGY